MNNLWTITLANGKQTSVLLASDLKDLSDHLGSYGRNVLWVFDTNTANLFKQLPPSNVVLESGEGNKNMASLTRILSTALDQGLARDSRIIGFGGGVVCDVASLAASLYMRGCQLTLVPTTLLCMSDACLGGKTAIDFEGQKNLIGSFYPAGEILLCMDTLRTLNENEFINGLAEVIKHALLSENTDLYKLLLTHKNKILDRDPETITKLVSLSLMVKRHFIEEDPTETKGIRQMLNLGHTFGHALECSTHFTSFSHGQSVAWGTCRAIEAGISLGITDTAFGLGAIKLFKSFGYQIDYKIGRGDWLSFSQHLAHDKKKIAGEVLFIIPVKQGEMKLQSLDINLVQKLVISRPY
ncbi:MAG: 3-dehydroquinate synthase family protein [Sphaerochaetaceae bacterium]